MSKMQPIAFALAVSAGKHARPEAAKDASSAMQASRAIWKGVFATMLCTASSSSLSNSSFDCWSRTVWRTLLQHGVALRKW